MSFIGLVGAAAFALAWIPQSLETWRRRRCDVSAGFLLLNGLGSASLAVYAFMRGDSVFTAINTLTTGGALLNLCVKRMAKEPCGRCVAVRDVSLNEGETERP